MTENIYKAMPDDELLNIRKSVHASIFEKGDIHKSIIDGIIQKYIPKYHLSALHTKGIVLSHTLPTGHNIEITFGENDWLADDKEFTYQINPASIGTFDIIENDASQVKIDYFSSIGELLNNTVFKLNLLDAVKKYYYEIEPLKNDMYFICAEIKKRDAERKKQEEKNRFINEFQPTFDAITNEHNNKNINGLYVAMAVGESPTPNAVYRKKPVKIMPWGVGTYDEMWTIITDKVASKYEIFNYKIIPTKQIKLISID